MNKNIHRKSRSLRKTFQQIVTGNKVSFNSTITAVGITGVLVLAVAKSAHAFNLYDGSASGNNLEVNLTTTLSYTGQLRVNSPSQFLEGPGNANGNDGDTNLQHGLVGNVFEAVPVLDIKDGDYGAHFSGQLYLNTTYLGTNQNGQPGTLNSIYVNKSNDYTSGTRNSNGENAQLLDAFVFGQHAFADGQTMQLKFGRQTLFWGQSLFSTDGISGGQAPINVVTAQDTISPQAQQVFMPVGQVVLTYQPTEDLTLQGYYQFEWEHDYFQGAGAYFNGSDFLDKGGQSLIVGSGLYFLRDKDNDPEHQNGQFGLSAQDHFGNYDIGLYGLRYDAKGPEVYAFPGQGGVTPFSTAVATGVAVGRYQVVYPRDIWLQGVSLSTNVGAANVAGEISAREHAPLVGGGLGTPTANNSGNNVNGNPLYPVGNVVNALASAIYVSPGVPLDPGGISVDGELAINHVVNVTQNRAALVAGHQATASSFEVVITPTYYDVIPNLQVTFPTGITYNYLGRSQFDAGMYHGTGSFNIGVTGTYKSVWIASLAYQDFLGKPDANYNADADRGYVSLNLQHSF